MGKTRAFPFCSRRVIKKIFAFDPLSESHFPGGVCSVDQRPTEMLAMKIPRTGRI